MVLRSKTGVVMYKWTWPTEDGGKLKKALNFHLNPEISVKVLGKNEANLKFTSDEEQITLPVAQMPDEDIPENPLFDPPVGDHFLNISLSW